MDTCVTGRALLSAFAAVLADCTAADGGGAGASRGRGWASWCGAWPRSTTMGAGCATCCRHRPLTTHQACSSWQVQRTAASVHAWMHRPTHPRLLRWPLTLGPLGVRPIGPRLGPDHPPASLRQAFAQEAVDRLTSTAYGADASLKLGAQSLSNMLYAYALLNHHPGTELLSGDELLHLSPALPQATKHSASFPWRCTLALVSDRMKLRIGGALC